MLPDIEEIAVAYATSNPKTYLISDNGGSPFRMTIIRQVGQYKVTVDSGIFYAFRCEWNYDDSDSKHYTFIADQMFMPDDGHCCLLKLKNKNRYVAISSKIYSFVPYNSERITWFYSRLNQNDVEYPIALTKTYAYPLNICAAIERKYFDPKINWKDAYSHIWGNSRSAFYDIPGYNWRKEDNIGNYNYNYTYKRLRSLVKYALKLPHLITIDKHREDEIWK